MGSYNVMQQHNITIYPQSVDQPSCPMHVSAHAIESIFLLINNNILYCILRVHLLQDNPIKDVVGIIEWRAWPL